MATQLEILQRRLPDEDDEELLQDFLDSAESIILNKRYPFMSDDDTYTLEKKYLNLQLRIAIELYNKQGAEGEMSHAENGTTRQYSSADVSESLLNEITPKARVFGVKKVSPDETN